MAEPHERRTLQVARYVGEHGMNLCKKPGCIGKHLTRKGSSFLGYTRFKILTLLDISALNEMSPERIKSLCHIEITSTSNCLHHRRARVVYHCAVQIIPNKQIYTLSTSLPSRLPRPPSQTSPPRPCRLSLLHHSSHPLKHVTFLLPHLCL